MKKKILYCLAYGVLKFLLKTYRFRFHFEENLLQAHKESPHGSVILACWHEHALSAVLSVFKRQDTSYTPLISRSKDGEWVAQLVAKFGHTSVRGSSHRGGKEAREELYQILTAGNSTGITVDGPRGPRRICRPGAVNVASKTGSPIIVFSAVAKNCFIFRKSWDQFQFPLPFTTIHMGYAPAIYVPHDMDSPTFEFYVNKVSEILNETEKKLEKLS